MISVGDREKNHNLLVEFYVVRTKQTTVKKWYQFQIFNNYCHSGNHKLETCLRSPVIEHNHVVITCEYYQKYLGFILTLMPIEINHQNWREKFSRAM